MSRLDPPPIDPKLVNGPDATCMPPRTGIREIDAGPILKCSDLVLRLPPSAEIAPPPFVFTLGEDRTERKNTPLVAGLDNYFSAALAGVAQHSLRSNEQHNPGEEMHWSRGKSNDHDECVRRHLKDIQDIKAYMNRHGRSPRMVALLLKERDALAWRSLAGSQLDYEEFNNAPLAPAARLPE